MSHLLLAKPEWRGSTGGGGGELTKAQIVVRQIVLDSVTSPNTRRSYALTLDEVLPLLQTGP